MHIIKQVNLSQDVLQPVSCYCNHQIQNEALIATLDDMMLFMNPIWTRFQMV